MHGSILPVTIPPGQPRGQVQPFGPGGEELFEADLSRGEGAGQIENHFLLFLWRTSLLGWRRTAWRRLLISRENH